MLCGGGRVWYLFFHLSKKKNLYVGAMIYLWVYLDTLLSEVVLRAALPADTRERVHETLAVSAQQNRKRQNGIIRWKHLLVFRKFRPLGKKEDTLLLWLWTSLFSPPHLPELLSPFPHLWGMPLDKMKANVWTLQSGYARQTTRRQLMWSKVPLKAGIQRRTRDYSS